ncbi:MAG: glycosyltransferase [Gammaproteobacteria bacterium]|jgi:glycosyltransferase involved in cell wall biosynthesis|nr:glycosyltransferase [Gammaproteobacteria bacterium]
MDISVVVTFHNENLLAKWMLEGFARTRQYAEDQGLAIEMICVLDTANEDTTAIVTNHPSLRETDTVVRVANRDLATSRNDGVRAATGEYVSIVDGDDYYSKEWLVRARARAREASDQAVVHPEYVVSFGTVHSLTKVIDQERDDYPLASCFKIHPWISTAFARAHIFRETPYTRCDAVAGYGYEDWHWNLETVAAGHRHITAPETALYYRRKAASMLTHHVQRGVTIRPSAFFRSPEKWTTWANGGPR